MAHPGGRPTDYTKELGLEICDKISNSSKGLRTLCNENTHWPDRSNIFRWRLRIKEFRDLYDEAKKNQVEALVDDCLDISDETSHDIITKVAKDGSEYEVCNSEYINRSRLRVDTRKWLAQKLAPKTYGDRTDHNHDVILRPEDALKELKRLAEGE